MDGDPSNFCRGQSGDGQGAGVGLSLSQFYESGNGAAGSDNSVTLWPTL